MLSDHNEMKLKINIAGNFPKTWRLNNILLNNMQIKEEISRRIWKYFELNENTAYQNLWDAVHVLGKTKDLNKIPQEETRKKRKLNPK